MFYFIFSNLFRFFLINCGFRLSLSSSIVPDIDDGMTLGTILRSSSDSPSTSI